MRAYGRVGGCLVAGSMAVACGSTSSAGDKGGSPGADASSDTGSGEALAPDGNAQTPEAGNDASPSMPVVGDCSNLPAAGTWQNVTPPALDMGEWCGPGNGSCPQAGVTTNGMIGTYGTNAFVLDPKNAGTIYLGTSSLGVWKSTDCGSSWVHIDTGTNASAIDGGRNWTMMIDPTDSAIYTVAGYGQGGVFKSTDGGVNWTQILTQNVLDATGATPCSASPDPDVCGNFGGFVEKLTMDPTNSQHLLAGFHSDCAGTTPLAGATIDSMHGWGCLAESTNAGQTWSLTTNAVPWLGTDGPGQMMVDAKTWFYATNSCPGIYRTTTGGVSPDGTSSAWTEVYSGCASGSVYESSKGGFYSGGNQILWSADGIGWMTMPNSPATSSLNGSIPMIDDGTTFYVGGALGYYTAPVSTGVLTLTQIASTPVTSLPKSPVEVAPTAYMNYDGAHHVLYSSNLDGGFWRYVSQ